MVIINGILANRVPSPKKISTEHKNSANTANARDNVALIPRIEVNVTGSSESNRSNLGYPCVNIIKATPVRKINSAKCTFARGSVLDNNFFIIKILACN